MPWSLLEDCSKEMAANVYNADDPTKRAIALAACKWAVHRLLPDDSVVHSALAALERGDYGDTQLLTSLQEHVDELDRRYFDAEEARQNYQPLFAKARVAGGVHAALGADPFRAVTRCLYELCAALETADVKAVVDRVLS